MAAEVLDILLRLIAAGFLGACIERQYVTKQ
jgi:hypothetical protein